MCLFKAGVETRRCCFEAMPRIMTGVSAELTSSEWPLCNPKQGVLMALIISFAK